MSIQRDNSLASLVQYGAEAEDSDAEAEPDFVDNISDEDEGPPSNQPALKRERDEADSEPTPPPVKKERRAITKLVSYGADDLDDEDESKDMEEDEAKDSDDSRDYNINTQESVIETSLNSELASSLSRSVQNMAADEIQLPPEPQGRCPKHLQDKIISFYEKMQRTGANLNDSIQNKKHFRNPSIYEKLINFIGIDEKGTNYPPEVYDPHSWGHESFYDELAKTQKVEMDKREKEKKDRTKVDFITGTAKKLSAEDLEKKRKSKWDTQPQLVSAVKPIVITTTVSNPPVVSVTTSATGTKTTVISAIGTISKKSK